MAQAGCGLDYDVRDYKVAVKARFGPPRQLIGKSASRSEVYC